MESEGRMKIKAVSGIMLTVLLIGMLTLAFNVQLNQADQKPQLLLETDKDVYISGKNVTIILVNIGTETVNIGGYPAWQIFTYPEEEPVYPKIFAFLAWSLDPGENDTFTWNQYNEFAQSSAEPGMYVIKDTQGLGLSTYFKIIAAEKIVPDDYPTIQEAINAATEGDTIFVRNGTYYENVVLNKSVSLIGENKVTTIIDGNMNATVVAVTADNVTISQFTIRNGGKRYAGISLSSSGNNITDNILWNNWCGISFEHYSAYNVIADNNITNNLNGVVGELWYDSMIIGNTLKDNLLGIWMGPYSSRNTIAFNDITNHWSEGISMWQSSNNTFEGNNITDNNRGGHWAGITIGFQVGFSSGNKFFHNNIANNGKQIDLQGQEEPIMWDDGYPSGGNYWSDYTGVDKFSGPYQNETGSDGIGDTPYIIDENNRDRYPLTEPEDQWVPPPRPQIKIAGIRPPEGLPGTKVLIVGEGATPNGKVVALLENFTSIVEIGTVEVVTIPVGETIADKEGQWDIWFEVTSFLLPGEVVVRVVDNETQTSDWTTFLVTAAQIIIQYVSPQSGPVGTSVYVSGSGAAPNGEARVYFDETNVANTTAQNWEWWSASFKVPDVEPGNYTITVLDVTTNTTDTAIFTVTPPPTIRVSPSEAPMGSKITISGEGFTPNQGVFITFEDLLLLSPITTDEDGEFNVTLFVPMINSGNYTIKAITTYPYQAAIANASFTVTLGVDTLLSQYASSNSSYYEPKNDYEELNASYYSLSNDYNDLQATYNFLLTNCTNLQGDYDSLSSNYNALEAGYNSLNSTYNDLKSKYDALTADLGYTRNLSYLLIITTIVFIATTLLFAIRKPRAKPEAT